MVRLAAAALLPALAVGGLLFGLVGPPNADEPSWVGQVVLPNATLKRVSTAPYNLYSPAQMVGLLSDGRTLVTLVANFTERHGQGQMDVVSLDLLTGAVRARVPSPLAMQGGEGLNQWLAVMPDANLVALVGANTTAPEAPLRVWTVDPSSGATVEFPGAAVNGSLFFGSWPGIAAYSTKSNTVLAHARSVDDPAWPAWHFFNMQTGAAIVRKGCWINSVGYDVNTDTFVGLEVTHNGTTINSTYVRVTRTPADGSADCVSGAGPVVFDEGDEPWALVEDVQGFDPEGDTLYAYASLASGGSALLVVNATSGAAAPLDASATPLPVALVVTGMCAGGAGGGAGACA